MTAHYNRTGTEKTAVLQKGRMMFRRPCKTIGLLRFFPTCLLAPHFAVCPYFPPALMLLILPAAKKNRACHADSLLEAGGFAGFGSDGLGAHTYGSRGYKGVLEGDSGVGECDLEGCHTLVIFFQDRFLVQ